MIYFEKKRDLLDFNGLVCVMSWDEVKDSFPDEYNVDGVYLDHYIVSDYDGMEFDVRYLADRLNESGVSCLIKSASKDVWSIPLRLFKPVHEDVFDVGDISCLL